MNEMINVAFDNDRPTVLGRDLHEALEIETQYTKWMQRMCEYGFNENEDYIAVSRKRLTAQGNETTYTDHQLTLDMAKQICMIQRTEAGRRYREYFLEVERKWNSPEAIMARSLIFANRQLEAAKSQLVKATAKIAELSPKAEYYDTVRESEGSTSFRDTAKLFGMKEKDFIKLIESKRLCYRNNRGKLVPYSDRLQSGWFEVIEVTYGPVDAQRTTLYTRITPKGRTEIFKRIKGAI